MKRWFLWGVVLVAAVVLMKDENRAGTDIAGLEPAQILWVENVAGGVAVATDAGQAGWGMDLARAVSDMEQTAAGQVFLDTAEYLLISPEARKWMPDLCRILRPSCQVCLADGVSDLTAVTEYLTGHEPDFTLGDWRKGETGLPVLYLIEERMYLAKP